MSNRDSQRRRFQPGHNGVYTQSELHSCELRMQDHARYRTRAEIHIAVAVRAQAAKKNSKSIMHEAGGEPVA